jgi:hypothetical protein
MAEAGNIVELTRAAKGRFGSFLEIGRYAPMGSASGGEFTDPSVPDR